MSEQLPKLTRWHSSLLLSAFALIALILFWHWRQPVPGLHPLLSGLLMATPVWAPLWGVLRARRTPVIWMATLSLLPFSHAVSTLTAALNPQTAMDHANADSLVLWGFAELLLSCAVFLSGLYTARWLGGKQ